MLFKKIKKMGYGKVWVSKERMCSYKHTHNGAVYIRKDIKKQREVLTNLHEDIFK